MSRQTYRDLIDALCRKSGIADPAPVHQHGHLTVNGVDFTLLHIEQGEDDLVVLYCDFGVLPQAQRETALQRLLEVNLFLYGGDGPSFSFNRESGHVLLMSQLRLSRANVESMLVVLRSMALYAQQWRGGHFLDDIAGEPALRGGDGQGLGRRAGTPFTAAN